MTNELVKLNIDGDVSIITLDDGKANVFSPLMTEAIESLLDQVPQDKGALLITGRSGIFSGGFDLKIMSSGDMEEIKRMVKVGFSLLTRIYSFPRPVVCACTGHAIALGAFLLLCGDYRLGAEGDFMIGANEVRNNMSVPEPILELSRTRINKTHWFRAILNAEMYAPNKAISAGYLDETIDPEKLMDLALKKASDLATLDHPVYQITKELDQAKTLNRIKSSINKM
ncbi:uncharacterized protein METZ01_LOCUS152435 [marine metagenome]|uniref:Enoyl-CoA hydratase n=1 Tax=marine metagenome TaxID=408172 RepID=A0A382AE71_9ZZZZ|tara:strand:+ start:227 stop:907 length:681 start_codon:yes stop_codon:yes gene_type:complete